MEGRQGRNPRDSLAETLRRVVLCSLRWMDDASWKLSMMAVERACRLRKVDDSLLEMLSSGILRVALSNSVAHAMKSYPRTIMSTAHRDVAQR